MAEKVHVGFYEHKYGVPPKGYLNVRGLGFLLEDTARAADIGNQDRWSLQSRASFLAMLMGRGQDGKEKGIWERESAVYFDRSISNISQFYSPKMLKEIVEKLVRGRRYVSPEAKERWLETALEAIKNGSSPLSSEDPTA